MVTVLRRKVFLLPSFLQRRTYLLTQSAKTITLFLFSLSRPLLSASGVSSLCSDPPSRPPPNPATPASKTLHGGRREHAEVTAPALSRQSPLSCPVLSWARVAAGARSRGMASAASSGGAAGGLKTYFKTPEGRHKLQYEKAHSPAVVHYSHSGRTVSQVPTSGGVGDGALNYRWRWGRCGAGISVSCCLSIRWGIGRAAVLGWVLTWPDRVRDLGGSLQMCCDFVSL
jgi:hypothetical protein